MLFGAGDCRHGDGAQCSASTGKRNAVWKRTYRWRLWRQSRLIITVVITSGSLQLSEYSDSATNRTAEVSDADWVSCCNNGGAHSGTGLLDVAAPLGDWVQTFRRIVVCSGSGSLKMKVFCSFETSGTVHPTAQCHVSEDFNAESKAKYGNNICWSDSRTVYTGFDVSVVLTDGVVKGEDVPVYTTKVYRGRALVHSLLTSVLDGGEWSASRPGRFSPGEGTPVPTQYEARWTPKGGMDI